MRILHTSDWHLGRLFHNVHLTEDQAHVLEQFVDLVRESNLDAVIIAGDIYDRAVPPPAAVELLDDVLSRLVLDIGVPTIVIAGNHDGAERLGFGSRLLKERGLHIAGTLAQGLKPISISDEHGPVQILPIPFAVPELVREWSQDEAMRGEQDIRGHQAAMKSLLAGAAKSIDKGHRSIAVAHAFVAGGQESDSERALSIGGSGQIKASLFADFDYVALGHLHRPQNIGGPKIRYSGSLLKYSFSEISHKKSVSLVEMDADGQVEISEIALSPRREVRSVQGTLEAILSAAAADKSPDDYLLAIVEDDEILLNPMAKLRTVYPNLLHIERPYFGASTMGSPGTGDHRKLETIDLFASFWKEAGRDEMSEAHRAVLAELIESSERER